MRLAVLRVRAPVPALFGAFAVRRLAAVPVRCRGRIGLIRHDLDLCPVAKPIGAVDHDFISRSEAGKDLHPVAVDEASFHHLNRDRAVGLDLVDERARRAVLDRRDRRDRHAGQFLDEQTRIHELVGKQRLVGVGERGAQLHGAGGGVDLVVEAFQGPGCDRLGVRAIVRRDRERLTRARQRPDLFDVILRNDEDHRDGLQLRQHDQPGRAGRLHIIARIHQAQADASGDRRDDVTIDEVELVGLYRALVLRHGALVLLDQELLVGDLLHARSKSCLPSVSYRLRSDSACFRRPWSCARVPSAVSRAA